MDNYHVPFLEHFGSFADALGVSLNVARLLVCARARTQPWKPIAQLCFLRRSADFVRPSRFTLLPPGLGQGNNVQAEQAALGLDEVSKAKQLVPSTMLPWATAEELPLGDLVRSAMSTIDVPPLRNSLDDLKAFGVEVKYLSCLSEFSLDGQGAQVVSSSEWLNKPEATMFAEQEAHGQFGVIFLTFSDYIAKDAASASGATSVSRISEPRIIRVMGAAPCAISNIASSACQFRPLIEYCLGSAAFENVITAIANKYAAIAASAAQDEVKNFYEAQHDNTKQVLSLGRCQATNLLCLGCTISIGLDPPALDLLPAVRLEAAAPTQERYDLELYCCATFVDQLPPLNDGRTTRTDTLAHTLLPAFVFKSARNAYSIFFGKQGMKLLDAALAAPETEITSMRDAKRKQLDTSPERVSQSKKPRTKQSSSGVAAPGIVSRTRSSGASASSSTSSGSGPANSLARQDKMSEAAKDRQAYESTCFAAADIFTRWTGIACTPDLSQEPEMEEDNAAAEEAAFAIFRAWT